MTAQAVNMQGLPYTKPSSKGNSKEKVETTGFPEIMSQATSAKNDNSASLGNTDSIRNESTQVDSSKPEPAMNDSQVDNVSEVDNVTKPDVQEEDMLDIPVDDIEETIQSIVTDELDITDEELNELLETLQMTMLDLLNPQNLQQLLLANSGENDPAVMLMDEGLANQWEELSNVLAPEQLAEQLGVTTEQLTMAMEQLTENAPEWLMDDLPSDEWTQDMNLQTSADAKVDNSVDEPQGPTIQVVRENESSQSDNLMNNQSQDNETHAQDYRLSNEQRLMNPVRTQTGEEVIHTFTQHLEQVMPKDAISNVTPQVTMTDIVNQVVEQIKVMIRPESTGMELQLNPEHLGKVNLAVEWKAGVATASFTVQNESAREALQSQIATLRENLEQQGLKIENVEVNVTEFAFNQSQGSDTTKNQGKKSKSSHRNIILGSDEGLGMEEESHEVTNEQLSVNGNVSGENIDYTA